MPHIAIYEKGILQESKSYGNTCWIIWLESNRLTCLVDNEQDKIGTPGEFKSRVYHASEDPEIIAVFPDWELIINDVSQPKRFYESVKGIKGKVVQLRYKDFECVLNFS